jgi:tRNA modification GTPase
VVEQEGIARARAAEEIADLAIVMIDRSRSLNDDDRALVEGTTNGPRLVIASKSDLPASWSAEALGLP